MVEAATMKPSTAAPKTLLELMDQLDRALASKGIRNSRPRVGDRSVMTLDHSLATLREAVSGAQDALMFAGLSSLSKDAANA